MIAVLRTVAVRTGRHRALPEPAPRALRVAPVRTRRLAFASLASLVFACNDNSVNPGLDDSVSVFFTRNGAPQAVQRVVPDTHDPLPFALAELLEGPTNAEIADGFSSFFHDRTATGLGKVEIRPDSLAIIDFLDFSHLIPDAASATGSARLLGELNHTVFQFPSVKSVIYRFNGSCSAFWNWLSQSCRTVRRADL